MHLFRTFRKRCSIVATSVLLSASIGTAAGAAEPPATPTAQMSSVLRALKTLGPKPIETLPPALARAQPSASDAVIQVIQDKGIIAPDKLPPVGKVEMKLLPGRDDGASIPIRVYTPKGDGPFPTIVYYHGGGWVIASLDTYDASCRGLCALNNAVVVSVDFRQAPENKFPAAVEDSYAALQYVASHGAEFNTVPAKLAVVGESAGGNLATDVCILAKQRSGTMPVAQVLVYPVTDYRFDSESYKQNADAKPLNLAMMKWFFAQYLNSPSDGENILVSPLRASTEQLKDLPPATIVTAEIDPLRNDGMDYADKLKAAGVDTESKDFTGVTHEFFGMALVVDEAKAANAFVTGRLQRAFDRH